MDTQSEQFIDQIRRFSAFAGVTHSQPEDRFFLVMGMTGSGKSTFISRCTGKDVTAGQGLFSCTSSIDVFDFTLNGRRIYFIDTPGFNDTNRSDIDTLKTLAAYLGASFANGIRIHGLIMLHSIADNRMSGSSLRNIELMKSVCGFTSYENLVIATTMWPKGSSIVERANLEDRETELLADSRFFGTLTAQGATLFRHNEKGSGDYFDEAASARRIVAHLVRQSNLHPPDVLRLQREIIQEGKSLGETAAGITIAGDLYKAQRAHELHLRELEREMKSQLANIDAIHSAELQQLKKDVKKELKNAQRQKQELEMTMQDMHAEEERLWNKNIEEMDRRFRDQLAAKEEELIEMEMSLEEIRNDVARRKSSQKQHVIQEVVEHENVVSNARKELIDVKSAYRRFRRQPSNMVNGTANGLAAGITSGLIAASFAGACVLM